MQLLQRGKKPAGAPPATDAKRERPSRGRRIRCPRCGWEPGEDDRWSCECGNVWNTFETGGECPRCNRRWRMTQCLACGEWSPHEEWYARDGAR